jgi:predicted glycosyltransferase
MRIVFFINTPAQVHIFKHIIHKLADKGHEIKVLARAYQSTLTLLDKDSLKYSIYSQPRGSKYKRFMEILPSVLSSYKLVRNFSPDIVVGIGPVEAFTSALSGKPCILFNADDATPIQHAIEKPFASAICTPSYTTKDRGKKHIRLNSYKELAYLSPDYFQPDPAVYDKLGINQNEKYVVLRFGAFDSAHDINIGGFSSSDKCRLVEQLTKYARVFISSETNLLEDLGAQVLPTPPYEIHNVLYYAQLLVCDTQTMATEAAVLGTPVVRCNSWVGSNDSHLYTELENKYGLLHSLREPELAIRKALDIIQQKGLKEECAKKRQRLLADKIDFTQFMVWFIENFPESFDEVKKKPGSQ